MGVLIEPAEVDDLQASMPGFARYKIIHEGETGKKEARELLWPENIAGPYALSDEDLLQIAKDLLQADSVSSRETDAGEMTLWLLREASQAIKAVTPQKKADSSQGNETSATGEYAVTDATDGVATTFGLESPYVTQSTRPTIYMHDGTPQNNNYPTDLEDALENRGKIQGLSAYTNMRAASLAGEGDLVVSNQPMLEQKRGKDRQDGDLNQPDYLLLEDHSQYYLSHSLIRLAQDYNKLTESERTDSPLNNLISKFVECNDESDAPVISLYTLDQPFQIFLLWLKQEVNAQRTDARKQQLRALEIQANSPEVSVSYNQKASLHPNIDLLEGDRGEGFEGLLADLKLQGGQDKPLTPEREEEFAFETLRRESLLSPLGLMLLRNIDPQSPISDLAGLTPGEKQELITLISENKELNWPSGPGYAVSWSQDDRATFITNAMKAIKRLERLYGTTKVRIKHNRSSDGDGVSRAINIADISSAKEFDKLLNSEIFPTGNFQDIVIEANVLPDVEGDALRSGSVHVISGQAPRYFSKEYTSTEDSSKWVGNGIVASQDAESELGFDPSVTSRVNAAMGSLSATMKYLPENSRLTMAGFDFFSGRLGGKFGNRVMATIADPNIRFTGAMPIIAQLEKVRIENERRKNQAGVSEQPGLYAAQAIVGKNIPVLPGISYSQLKDALKIIQKGNPRIHMGIIFFTGDNVMLSATGNSLAEAEEEFEKLLSALKGISLLA